MIETKEQRIVREKGETAMRRLRAGVYAKEMGYDLTVEEPETQPDVILEPPVEPPQAPPACPAAEPENKRRIYMREYMRKRRATKGIPDYSRI